ncbi:MAG TPA: hypothetical protein VKB80_09070, partial [Kofleriaceae bacterium]|nr:hypothetical protein [Kofleriaceae bacterium]
DGGGHDPLNLAVACSIHHDLVHRGLIVVEGSAPDLIFRHADGRPYGQLQADDAHLIAGLRGAGAPTAEPQRPPVPGTASGARTAESRRPLSAGAASAGTGRAVDLEVRQADGSLYCQPRADDADVTDVITGLRRIGVPAHDARRAVAEASASGVVAIEDLLRQALLVLGRTTYAGVARVSQVAPHA